MGVTFVTKIRGKVLKSVTALFMQLEGFQIDFRIKTSPLVICTNMWSMIRRKSSDPGLRIIFAFEYL